MYLHLGFRVFINRYLVLMSKSHFYYKTQNERAPKISKIIYKDISQKWNNEQV